MHHRAGAGTLIFACAAAVGIVAFAACAPEVGVLGGHTFSADSLGNKKVNTADSFWIDAAGVSNLGACKDPRETAQDTTIGISDVALKFLVMNGYCQWSSPEYHDDQKLPINGGTSYGPLVHTFAAPVTSQFQSPAIFDRFWINVAIIIVEGAATDPLPKEYTDLKLQRGFNCLFLHFDPNANSYKKEWRAVMLPSDKLECAEQASMNRQFDQILTIGDHGPTSPSDYPAVSRFIEGKGHETFIGVRCGNVWCMVGVADRGDVRAATHDGMTNPGGKNWKVKGWFDDQHLAVPATPGSSTLIPGPSASIVPAENLASITDYSLWQHVATVTLDGNADYSGSTTTTGYSLHPGANQLWLHSRTLGSTVKWEAYIGNAPPTPGERLFSVRMTGHGYFIPGTARWRWTPGDEHLWVACLMGCCLVDPN